MKKIELYQKCPHCGDTWGERMPCGSCTRGFISIHPHVTVVVEEDGSVRVLPITPHGVDVTFDIIDEADGGIIDEELTYSERTLQRILDELFPNWYTLSWVVYVYEGLEARDFILDGFALNRLDSNRLNEALYDNDIDLTNWNVTEVRRADID